MEISIEKIQAHRASDGEWFTVVEGPITFDFSAMAGIEEVLGSAERSPDTYTQIRLDVTSAMITENGTQVEARIPSGEIKIVRSFEIIAGETTIVTLDFDAERSVVAQGTGAFQLRPTVKLLVRKGGEPFQPEAAAPATPTATPTVPIQLAPGGTPVPTVIPTAAPTATPTPEATGALFLDIEFPEEVVPFHTESTIEVVGRTRVDAAISVNDEFADVDEDGRFRVSVQLEDGANIIEVVASIDTGEEIARVLTVIYVADGV